MCVCELNYSFLAHLMQQTPNPVNELAYMELRSDYLSPTSPTAVVGTHNEVSVMVMSTLTEHDLINYRTSQYFTLYLYSTVTSCSSTYSTSSLC